MRLQRRVPARCSLCGNPAFVDPEDESAKRFIDMARARRSTSGSNPDSQGPPMFDLITPVASVPWYNIILILATAVVASGLIVFSTRRSVRSIGEATAKMLASIEGAHRATTAQNDAIVAVGRGEVAWKEGGYTMRLVRRIRAISGEDAKDEELAVLAQKLVELGINADDLEDKVAQSGETVTSVGMMVAIRDPGTARSVLDAAQAAGFSEDGLGREEITDEDAHGTAGQRAVEDAERNVGTLAAALGIPRASIQLVGADLETAQSSDGKVVKIARTRWRQVVTIA